MEITVTFKRITEKAFLVIWEGDEIWLPKSVVTVIGDLPRSASEEVELEVEDWFAEKEGLA